MRRPVEGLQQGEPSQTADDNEEGLYLLDFNITNMELSPAFIQYFYATKSEDFQTSISIFFRSIFDAKPACSTVTEYTVGGRYHTIHHRPYWIAY